MSPCVLVVCCFSLHAQSLQRSTLSSLSWFLIRIDAARAKQPSSSKNLSSFISRPTWMHIFLCLSLSATLWLPSLKLTTLFEVSILFSCWTSWHHLVSLLLNSLPSHLTRRNLHHIPSGCGHQYYCLGVWPSMLLFEGVAINIIWGCKLCMW